MYKMMKTAFRNDSLSRSKTFNQFKKLSEDDPHSERPSVFRDDDAMEEICKNVQNDCS